MAKDDAKKVKGGTSPAGSERLGLRWLKDVVAHDFDVAPAYLSLKLDDKQAAEAVFFFSARPRSPVAGPTTSCAPVALSHCLWTTPVCAVTCSTPSPEND